MVVPLKDCLVVKYLWVNEHVVENDRLCAILIGGPLDQYLNLRGAGGHDDHREKHFPREPIYTHLRNISQYCRFGTCQSDRGLVYPWAACALGRPYCSCGQWYFSWVRRDSSEISRHWKSFQGWLDWWWPFSMENQPDCFASRKRSYLTDQTLSS